jgi:heterodisulfide reductase subunit A
VVEGVLPLSENTINAPVLVVGGGVAGLAACLSLSRLGLASILVERGNRLGGRARELGCKATDSCARCGACRLADLLRQIEVNPTINILTGTKISQAKSEGGSWLVELTSNGGAAARTVRAAAVILAVGAVPFDPSQKTRFGYRQTPGVVSALELEQALEGDLSLLAGGSPPGRVAFIQCVGSRDESLGNLYCSRVCCGFALRMARVIRHRYPEAQVTFFHMDVQGYGRAWEDELDRMRKDIRFVRAMPGEVVSGDNGPELVYAPPEGDRRVEGFDLVVLSQGLRPPLGADGLAGMFNLGRTPDNFLASNDPAGVFVAGSARGPMSLSESMEHGARAAALAAAHVNADEREAAHA